MSAYGVWGRNLYNQMEILYDMVEHPVCIRSSSINEDGKKASMAGHYSSRINVRNFSEYLSAIRECWKSSFQPQIIRQMKKNGLRCQPIPLILQTFQLSITSGVAFYSEDKITISATYGLCLGVVSGNINCDEYTFDTKSKKWNSHIAEKEKCYLPFSYEECGLFCDSESVLLRWKNGNIQQFKQLEANNNFSVCLCGIKRNPFNDIRNTAVLNEVELEELRLKLKMISQHLGFPNLDCEWCQDIEGQFYILQARPFINTYTSVSNRKNGVIAKDKLQGVAISGGVYNGKVVIYHSEQDKRKINEGDIVALKIIPDDFMDIIWKVGAIILKSEVLLSHCAIIAREWGIPCVGGISLERLCEGVLCKVDGDNGIVEMIER